MSETTHKPPTIDGPARGGAALVIERVPLSALHADPSNVNTHPEENLAAIAGSLRQFGQVEPLVVQRSTGKTSVFDDGALAKLLESLPKDLQHDAGYSDEQLAELLRSLGNGILPGSIDDQSRLDQKAPTICPECGHEWVA